MPRMTKAEVDAFNARHFAAIDPDRNAVARESELHDSIYEECRRRGWLPFHGAMYTRTHRGAGEPDFIILRDGGRLLLVECKSKTGKLSPEQCAVVTWAEHLGHKVHVVRSLAEFMEVAK